MNNAPQEIPLWEGQAPGGGYGALAMDHEGRQVAAYFNAMGVAAFVLKYRLGPKYRHPIQLGDAQRVLPIRTDSLGVGSWKLGVETGRFIGLLS